MEEKENRKKSFRGRAMGHRKREDASLIWILEFTDRILDDGYVASNEQSRVPPTPKR